MRQKCDADSMQTRSHSRLQRQLQRTVDSQWRGLAWQLQRDPSSLFVVLFVGSRWVGFFRVIGVSGSVIRRVPLGGFFRVIGVSGSVENGPAYLHARCDAHLPLTCRFSIHSN